MGRLMNIMYSCLGFVCSFLLFTGLLCLEVIAQGERGVFLGDRVVDAVNCGGPPHTDVFGINFRADPLEGKIGTSSDHGRRFLMGRVPPPDQILYQTERYHDSNFEYEFRVPEDGDFVLVLKFSEVYFTAPSQKVFDVSINDEHQVLSSLDIFEKVGRAVALDEVVPFTVKQGKLKIAGEVSEFKGKIIVQFLKGAADNPKVNAIYVLKGSVNDVPPLPPLERETAEEEREEEREEEGEKPPSPFASGPKAVDPHSHMDPSQTFLPILIALACFFPVLFCLCKL